MIKLADILAEITIPAPEDAYPLSEPMGSEEDNIQKQKFFFKNSNEEDMAVEANFEKSSDALYVVFYRESDVKLPGEGKYAVETGSGDMMKILATVVEAINRAANNLGGVEGIERIRISPADKRRFNIYKHYAEVLAKEKFKDFVVKGSGSWIELINKNYKHRYV